MEHPLSHKVLNRLHFHSGHVYSRTLTTEKGQLFCRNTSVWLLPLQTETKPKTSNSAQLTSKTVNFNFTTIYLKHYASVCLKNFRSYVHRKTITNHFNRSLVLF